MVLPYAELMQLERRSRFSWTERDVIIYALGVGLPSDPLDLRQLNYVYEDRLSVLPTFAATIPLDENALTISGMNYAMTLHGEQSVTLHKPIPPRGEAEVHCRIVGAWDKGEERGAVLRDRAELRMAGEDAPFATVVSTCFARSDGGFGGPREGQPEPHSMPGRAPDRSVVLPTTRNQALLYRVSGDLNPLHVDPEAARKAGFSEPILHGLCSYGICQHAVLAEYCGYEPDRISHIEVRFRNVVFPGESLRVDLWRDEDVVSFEAIVVERDCKAISNGKVLLSREKLRGAARGRGELQ